MAITRKTQTVLLSAIVLCAAPFAAAQVPNAQSAERVQQVQVVQPEVIEEAKTPSPASWHGKRVALRGRDVVSFHKDSGPTKGSRKFVAEWDNTKWYFANEDNRDAFKTDPRKYIPEFGGYCPVALSKGEVKVGRTNQFTRVDDKLYLNYNKRNQEAFSADPDAYILKAQVSW